MKTFSIEFPEGINNTADICRAINEGERMARAYCKNQSKRTANRTCITVPINWDMTMVPVTYTNVLMNDDQLEYRMNIDNVKSLTHIASELSVSNGTKYIDFKRDTTLHNVDLLGNPIGIKRFDNIYRRDETKWNKRIKRRKKTTHNISIKLKPYPFSNDDKYISKLVSLGIDFAPKKKLAPVKPIPNYNALKRQKKYARRTRMFKV